MKKELLKRMYGSLLTFICLLLLLFPIKGFSQDTEYLPIASTTITTPNRPFSMAASLKVGTVGPGAEFAMSLHDRWDIRVSGSYFQQSFNIKWDHNITLNNVVTIGGIGLLTDWRPSRRDIDFRFTGGVVYSLISYEGSGGSSVSYKVLNTEYTPDRIGFLDIKIRTNHILPYLGIGFGGAVPRKTVGFKLEVGTLFNYQAQVNMSATQGGVISPTANPQNENIIKQNMKNYNFYPVISLQIIFKIRK